MFLIIIGILQAECLCECSYKHELEQQGLVEGLKFYDI